MNQEKVVQIINQSIEEMGVKGIFLANSIGISYTFMKQVLNGERNFSEETLKRATDFFNRYPDFFSV